MNHLALDTRIASLIKKDDGELTRALEDAVMWVLSSSRGVVSKEEDEETVMDVMADDCSWVE